MGSRKMLLKRGTLTKKKMRTSKTLKTRDLRMHVFAKGNSNGNKINQKTRHRHVEKYHHRHTFCLH
ncbi:hypothetical protein GCK32_002253 [Trichostrongylus colubriformis]|uniref:Uncharacterized protein n=1 Tax=Trichostrongylus colubriformis TaxID=6319 RepID=A0AAN8GEI8_TRICO